jgi:hypothetical protein
VTAREEAMAAIATVAAAIKNNEQKIRRHGDGVNVRVRFEFVIIELLAPMVVMDAKRTFNQTAANKSTLFPENLIVRSTAEGSLVLSALAN